MPKKASFVVDEKDNVATILQADLKKGDNITVTYGTVSTVIELKDSIPYGHKVAIRSIKQGESIIKYGLAMGVATKDITVGEHVHVHNVESKRGRGDLFKRG